MKAILILDEMPDSCEKCPLLRYDVVRRIGCAVTSNIVIRKVGEKKPKWCPLCLMPEEQDICGTYPREDEKTPSYFIGWNDALRAIEGSGEDD
ncbi:MAG: hypothetical protein LUF35_05660 [Lachnospiraceae bacterium]|nr:hypothetical protein [Lachnospiraceae bacterium]